MVLKIIEILNKSGLTLQQKEANLLCTMELIISSPMINDFLRRLSKMLINL